MQVEAKAYRQETIHMVKGGALPNMISYCIESRSSDDQQDGVPG